MANSVSRINVEVGANVSQLASGMGNAAGIVQRGMGNVQTIAQQATFAVDDFFAAFSTGGVAGGIRGATNNLTMIASSIGGIKTQLVAIAALSAAQFAVKWWDDAERKRVEASTKAIDEWRNSIQAARDAIAASGNSGAQLRAIGRSTDLASLEQQRGDLSAQGQVSFQQGADLLALRNRLDTERQNLRFTSGRTAEQNKRLEAIDQEIASTDKLMESLGREDSERIKLVRGIEAQIKAIKEAETARQRVVDSQFEFKPLFNRGEIREEIREIDAQLAQLRQEQLPSLSMASVFRMLPEANMMGSSGAVSAINAAMTGPQNARDSGPALQRETNAILKRIEDLEKKKKGLVEVIGL